jgi:hypothetical protein
MVKAWKQSHISTEVSQATSGGAGAGNTAVETVPAERKPSPPGKREDKSKKSSNNPPHGDDSSDDSSTGNSGDDGSSGGESDENRSKPSRKL